MLAQRSLEDETGKKGYLSLMLLVAQLEKAHERLKPAVLSGPMRRGNTDAIKFKESINRIDSFV